MKKAKPSITDYRTLTDEELKKRLRRIARKTKGEENIKRAVEDQLLLPGAVVNQRSFLGGIVRLTKIWVYNHEGDIIST